MKKLLFFLTLFLLGASCQTKEDSSHLGARDAGDLSVVFSTDGDGHRIGLAHVILSEAGSPSGVVNLILPDSPHKVFLIGADGLVESLGSVESIKIEELVGPTVEKLDGGPYRVLVSLQVKVEGMVLMRSMAGVVYVTVLSEGYSRLGCNSPDSAFAIKIDKKTEAQYSSKLRSALCER